MKTWSRPIIVLTVLLMGTLAPCANGAWREPYLYRQAITISSDTTDADLTNFPVLIQITNANNAVFANAMASGNDIVFTASDGATKLAHERERFVPTGGSEELDAWVKIPSLSSTVDTTIYMYYGHSTAADQQDATNVWDSDYVGVWHMSEDVDAQLDINYDSTSSGSDMTRYDGGTGGNGDIAGQIGRADGFDGIDDQVANATATVKPDTFTISGWFKVDNEDANFPLVGWRPYTSTQYPAAYVRFGSSAMLWMGSSNYRYFSLGGTPVTNGNWYHIAFTVPGANQTDITSSAAYLDGSALSSWSTKSTSVQTTKSTCRLGNCRVSDGWADGGLDEVRLSKTVRSADWIKAEYETAKNPDSLLAVGDEEKQVQNSWYEQSGYLHRQAIIISSDTTAADLSDFPVLIQITNANNDVFEHAQEGGNDIVFTASDGTTKLAHERERFVPTGGSEELDAWVKIPSLSASADTTIYMYYGHSAAVDQQDATNVWDSDYVGVWHMSEDVDAQLDINYDSTSSGSDMTRYDGGTGGNGDIVGQIGRADGFDGIDDQVLNATATVNPDTFTISGWFKVDNEDANFPLVGWRPYTSTQYPAAYVRFGSSAMLWMGSSNYRYFSLGGTPVTNGNWYHIAFTVPGANQTDITSSAAYLDGSALSSWSTASTSVQTTKGMCRLGNCRQSDGWADGGLDEVRLSTTVRSAAWIKAEYETAKNSDSLLAVGDEVDYVPHGTRLIIQ